MNKQRFVLIDSGIAEPNHSAVCQEFVSPPIHTLVTEAKGLGRENRGRKWMGSFQPEPLAYWVCSSSLVLIATGHWLYMYPGQSLGSGQTVDLRRFKEVLRKRLPAGSPVLSDLLLEPDSMPVGRAEVLIPSYLDRLERELEKGKAAPGIPTLRA